MNEVKSALAKVLVGLHNMIFLTLNVLPTYFSTNGGEVWVEFFLTHIRG